MHKRLFLLFVLIFCFSINGFAKPLTARVSESQISLDDSLYLEVTAEGSLDGDVELSQLEDFEVAGRSSSSSYSWINGKTSHTTMIRFNLSPKRAGTLKIPALKAKIDGKVVESDPVTVEVHESGATPGQAPASSSLGVNPQQQQQQNPGSQNSIEDPTPTAPIFIRRVIRNPTPYVGEPILIETRIYHRVRVMSLQPVGSPNIANGRLMELDQTRDREEINGNVFDVVVLRQIFIPTRPGQVTLDPYELETQYAKPKKQRSNGGTAEELFFEFFGQGQEVENKRVRSQPNNIEVKELPKDQFPPGVNDYGLVGIFKMTGGITPKEIKMGETTTLTVVIEGRGLLDVLGKFQPKIPEGVKIYQDKPVIVEKANAERGVLSKRTFKFALVPTHPGSFNLGKVEIPYFDLQSKKYEILSLELGELKVTGEAAPASSPIPAHVNENSENHGTEAHQNPVKILGEDVGDIRRNIGPGSFMFGMGFGALFSLFLFILGFVVFGIGYANYFNSQNSKSLLKARAYGKFLDAIKNCSEIPKIVDSFKIYCAHTFDLNAEALTRRDMEQLLVNELQKKGVRENSETFFGEDWKGFKELLRKDELIEFGGNNEARGISEEQIGKWRDNLRNIVKKMMEQKK